MKSIYSKSLFTIALAWFALAGVFGQGALTNSTAPTAINTTSGEEIDYVTVGSQLQYKVTPTDFGSLGTSFKTIFGWTVTDVSGSAVPGAYTLYNAAGPGSLTNDADATNNAGYFTENEISVYWPTVGNYKLNTTERVRVTPFCSGNPVSQEVHVLNRPKVTSWNVTTSPTSCGLTGNVSIPFKCNGSRTITVAYSVTYTPLTGSPSAPTTGTATVDLGSTVYDATDKDGAITIPVTSTNYGTYSVQITGVTDNVTTKCFSSYTTAAADMPAAAYVFYSLPTPQTQPIQHVTNL
ncbi:MAG: hypothetical protein Q8903_05675 [Bacteroidota bacterium]|nr:hypothetical protein [Bacteroidota bacterium]